MAKNNINEYILMNNMSEYKQRYITKVNFVEISDRNHSINKNEQLHTSDKVFN